METPNPRAMEVNLETDQQVQSKDKPQRTELKRGLSARHMQMIAIGGAIGTGLFVASGATISTAGPGGALAAYAVIGLMVLLLMQSLGEMSAHMPVAGSFQTYATRFVSPSFGFAMGWNYWFNWAITVAAELVASGLVMSYWLPSVPSWVWAISFLFLLTFLNALSARVYGEAEFWFALIKVITVVVFLISGTLMIFGIFNDSPGVQNWTAGDAPFHGGFLSIISVFMIAGFSFQGTELVGVAAGESSNPRRDVPRAIKTVFWRIMFFYIGAIAIIGTLIPYTDPNLLRDSAADIAYSPFTLVFERMGVAAAAAVMNAVILTAILSAGNSGLYASTRMLHSMSEDTAYTWLLNVSGLSGFIVWLGIAACHWRFRRAYVKQGHSLDELPYKAPFFPFGPILAFGMCLIVLLGQNYEAVFRGQLLQVASSYIGLPVFLLIWLGYHLVKKDRTVSLDEMDVEGVTVTPENV